MPNTLQQALCFSLLLYTMATLLVYTNSPKSHCNVHDGDKLRVKLTELLLLKQKKGERSRMNIARMVEFFYTKIKTFILENVYIIVKSLFNSTNYVDNVFH